MEEVCLDDEKIGRLGFQSQPNHEYHAGGRLRRENNFVDCNILATITMDSKVIREISDNIHGRFSLEYLLCLGTYN